jgi:hypothetical protein
MDSAGHLSTPRLRLVEVDMKATVCLAGYRESVRGKAGGREGMGGRRPGSLFPPQEQGKSTLVQKTNEQFSLLMEARVYSKYLSVSLAMESLATHSGV